MNFKKYFSALSVSVITAMPLTVFAAELHNPLGKVSVAVLVGRVINAMLGIVGSVALLMFILGGWKWLTSGGESEKITKGLETMKWAVIGLMVIFAAYPLTNFVITQLGSATR